MNMKITRATSHRSQAGFSLLELVMVCALMTIVLASIFNTINLVAQRSTSEQTKVDLTQEGREFVDEFERDLHQAGYPNCRMVSTVGVASNCPIFTDPNLPAVEQNNLVAAGLVYVSNTQVVFEGDVDGDGVVDSIAYRLVDSAGNFPPTGTCPCTVKRSQIAKVNGTMPLAQLNFAHFSQELQNVVNSGVPQGGAAYGGGLQIAGTTAWGQSDTSFYAAISSFKDFPAFQAYDQTGSLVTLPQDLSVAGNELNCSSSSTTCIKTIRLTIDLLANATTGVDLKTKTRPVTTLVGDARLVNN